MSAEPLDSTVSEFATRAEEEDYDRWFRAKVAASFDDPRPAARHDEAMTRIDKTLDAASRKHARA
jgi:hypothetical protein